MSAFEPITRQLGLQRLDFAIDEHSRGKIMRSSILAGVVLMAQLVMLLLDLYYSSSQLSLPSGFGGAPEIWHRVYTLAANIQVIQVLALASLFAAGIVNWSRSEGSWAFAIAVCLAGISLALGGGAAILELVTQDADFLSDVRVFTWQRLAGTCGLLAIGYFFLAYRGLTSQRSPRRRRRIRRPHPSSSLPALED